MSPKTAESDTHHRLLRLHGAASWCHCTLTGTDTQTRQPTHPLERKHAALLAYLWLEGATPRSRMAGLLWPEVSEERARGNLRQRLLKLRQDAGDLVDDQAGLLSLATGVTVVPAVPAGAALLQSLEFDDCEAFAHWLDGKREAEREQRKRQWLAEVRSAANCQRLDDALYAADQLLQTDRESEEAFRVLMEVYYLRGDHAAAISAWDRCRDMMRQLYGVLPSATTQQLGLTLLEAAESAQATQEAWAPTPSDTPHLPASVLRPPRLVGRELAMQSLAAGWQAGNVLCVAGVAGVGKTRLITDWAAALGACAVAAARPGDAVLPYASLTRLLLTAVDRFTPPLDSPDASHAARLLPRFATFLTTRLNVTVEPVQTDYERGQAILAVARFLKVCMQRGCQALVLDDLQFADTASVDALRSLVEATALAPHSAIALRFAFGLRPEESHPGIDTLLNGLSAAQRSTRVDLAALSADESQALLNSLGLPPEQVGRWGQPIWKQVGGNPAFLLESVKLLLTTRAAPDETADKTTTHAISALPPNIETVIQRRLELLTPRARHLAQLAAIAGNGYSIPLAAAALACAPMELTEPLRELELRQVFDGRQFVHDVIAQVAQRSVPSAVAEFMHRFVAEHLIGTGAEPAHIGTHWLACGEWRRAGRCFLTAGQNARKVALANEQATLTDMAISAFERDTASHDELFDAVEERAGAYESTGHEGLRPHFVQRLQDLARTEAQQLSALNHQQGWLANLAKPLDEEQLALAIPRSLAAGRPDLAWLLTRTLGVHWAMNNRANEGLTLLSEREAWVDSQPDHRIKALYRISRSSIFAFSDQLAPAIQEGTLAIVSSSAAQDWANALPAMSNVGLMHYWRGEYQLAHDVLAQAREHRERLYGSGGSGIKIDVHLGAVLFELNEADAARAMLRGALAEMRTWPDNDYRRTECLLVHNHLAQMAIALGQRDEAAAVLAEDASGVADRFLGRRLTLRLRWQRVFGGAFGEVDAGLREELQALVARLASPFNKALMELELSRYLPATEALAVLQTLHNSPPVQQRPGLQLHAAVLACQAAFDAGDHLTAQSFAQAAQTLQARCAPFDMTTAEVTAVLQRCSGTLPQRRGPPTENSNPAPSLAQ